MQSCSVWRIRYSFSDLLFVASQESRDHSQEMSDHQAMATDFAQEFLAASPSRGDVAETSPQSPSSSSSPGPVEEEQTFSPDWVAGQFTKPNGRKEGDSGFISPDGATNQGTNPFYGANFHPTLNQDSSTNLTVSAADSDCES